MNTKFNIKKVMLLGGVIILLFILIAETLSAQKGDNDGKNNNDNQPKVDIHVKKQKDQNGNVISYDSTYTWSWSGNENTPANVDSVFKSMQEQFFKNFSFKTDPFYSMPFGFRSPSLKDTSKAGDPFDEMFGDDWADMDKMMHQRQKMMEEFFHQEPLLKVPDGVDKPVAPKQKEEKKQNEEKKKEPEKSKAEQNSDNTIDL